MNNRPLPLMLILGVVIFAPAMAAEPTVHFSPAASAVMEGQTFAMEISMRNFPLSEGGGVNLRFHPDVLQVESVVIDGAVWSFANRIGEVDNEKGLIPDILFSSLDGVAGDPRVATVVFRAVRKGRSYLRLTESGLNPFASDGARLDVVLEKGVVRVGSSRGRADKPKQGSIQ